MLAVLSPDVKAEATVQIMESLGSHGRGSGTEAEQGKQALTTGLMGCLLAALEMTSTMNICVRKQRVTGQTSLWHRSACRYGIVGGDF